MAEEKRHIPRPIKRRLLEEAGGKCANPGCSNTKTEFHHIKHWAVYKAHRAEDMIAVCPSCHDAAHHGTLRITDELLYEWKQSKLETGRHHDVLFVEPAKELSLLAGSLRLTTRTEQLITFHLSNKNTLAFRVEGLEIMLLQSTLRDLAGIEVLEVRDNRVAVKRDDDVTFERRTGRVRITVPASDRYIYPEMISQMRAHDLSYAADGRIIAVDLQVVQPGVVRVLGAWPAPEGGVIITEKSLSCLLPGNLGPISFIGEEGARLIFDGDINGKLFNFGSPKKAGAIFSVETVLHNRPRISWP